MAIERSRNVRWAFGLALAWLACASALADPASGSTRSEYDVKAVFLFNFAKFVTWPPEVFDSPTAPVVIGVLGEDPFGEELPRLARDLRVQGRSLVVRRGKTVAQLAQCHVVFISASERERLPQVMAAFRELRSRALTVADTDEFLEAGGMIRFVVEHNKVRFEIRPDSAAQAGLTISAKLLSLGLNSRPRA